MNKKSLKQNSILNAFRMLLTVLVPLITFPYTSRIFLTEGSGEISFVQATVQIFTLFASLGIYTYGLREGAKVRGDRQKFSKLAFELFSINLITTVATYVVFLLMINLYPAFAASKTLFLINGVSIGFAALGLDWVFGAFEDYLYITLRQIALQIFIVITMFFFVHTRDDIYIWMTLLTISTVGANAFNFFYARKYISLQVRRKLEIKQHIKPVLVLFATALATRVYSNLDTLLLGIQATKHNVGLYSAAVKMNSVLITMFSAMTPVFLPRLTECLNKEDREQYHGLLKKIFRMILSLSIPTVIGLEMVSGEIINLLSGPAFADAVKTMRILAPIVLVCACANTLYNNVLIPNGKENSVLKCTLVGAIINLIISALLIPKLQENGAAVGSLISEVITLGMAFAYCRRDDRDFLKTLPGIMNYLLGGAGIVAFCFLMRKTFESDVLTLICSVIGSVLVYSGILSLRKDEMAAEGINLLKKMVNRIRGGIST